MYSNRDSLPSELELTAMGRNIQFLMQTLQDEDSLNPYNKPVAFRIIRRIADILMYKDEPELPDPWSKTQQIEHS